MRVSDEELEACCDDKIAKEYPNMIFHRLAFDLRDIRTIAREAVRIWDKNEPMNRIADWLNEVEAAFDKLREAVGGKDAGE